MFKSPLHAWTGAAIAAALLFVPPPLRATDWPQWRGPFFNGSTDEDGFPERWGPGENIVWTTDMPGPAESTPAVAGGRVFLTSLDTASNELLGLCYGAADGKLEWRQSFGTNIPVKGGASMASPSPVTDGKKVYFLFANGAMAGFTADGRELWRRDLTAEFGPFVVKFGYSSSPLLLGDKLYFLLLRNVDPGAYQGRFNKVGATGQLDSFLACLDPATGQTLWKQVRPTDATSESTEAYVTPIPCPAGDRTDVVVAGAEFVTGHDPATGAERWRWEFSPPDRRIFQRVVTSPVCGDGLVYVVRPKFRPLYALRAGGTGRLGDDRLVWQHNGPESADVCSPLLYRQRLYMLDGDKRVLVCFKPDSGEIVWKGKLEGKGPMRASPTGAGGKIYLMSGDGQAFVVAAGDEFKLLSTVAAGAEPSYSSIVAANGRLYVRTATQLTCVGQR